jgi:hypothetical protein
MRFEVRLSSSFLFILQFQRCGGDVTHVVVVIKADLAVIPLDFDAAPVTFDDQPAILIVPQPGYTLTDFQVS